MRYNRLDNRGKAGGEESDRKIVRSRIINSSSTDDSKRLVLIVSCIVLAILCVLLLFQTCKEGEKDNRPKTIEQGKKQLVSAQFYIFNNVSNNSVTCPSHYEFDYQTRNSITATAPEILNLIVLNANRTYGDGTWAVGKKPSTSEIHNFINYNYTCYEALLAFLEQWNLSYNIEVEQNTGTYIINIFTKSTITPQESGNPTGSGSTFSSNSGKSVAPPETELMPQPPIPQPDIIDSYDSLGSKIIAIVSFIILLAAYITAKIKKDELIITANIFDKILILLSPTLFFIAWCIGFDKELSEAQIILLSMSGLMLQGSIIISVIANKGNWLNITLSILAKLFIFVVTVFLLFLLLTILIISIFLSIMSHSSHEGTYIVKYDHFLDQWVGYRVE